MDELLLYRRSGARGWGTRNHVLVLPLVASASGIARALGRGSGATWVEHDYEPAPDDLPQNRERIARTLVGFATNPNVGAVLLIADAPERSALLDRIRAAGQEADLIVVTEAGGLRGSIDLGRGRLASLLARAAEVEREAASPSALMLGTECGGSDALSGITANPALGVASDHLVDAGGTVVLAETTELIGAEHLLAGARPRLPSRRISTGSSIATKPSSGPTARTFAVRTRRRATSRAG